MLVLQREIRRTPRFHRETAFEQRIPHGNGAVLERGSGTGLDRVAVRTADLAEKLAAAGGIALHVRRLWSLAALRYECSQGDGLACVESEVGHANPGIMLVRRVEECGERAGQELLPCLRQRQPAALILRLE